MKIEPKNLADVFPIISYIVNQAGRYAFSCQKGGFEVEFKDDMSPVTLVDRNTEELLRKMIREYFPGSGILGEEFGEEKGENGFRFILDPIDGTRSFIAGVPLWGTLLALEYEASPILGAMYVPTEDDVLIGAPGHGCKIGQRQLDIRDDRPIEKARAIIGDFKTTEEEGLGDFARRLTEKVYQIRGWGDCYGYYLLAAGKAEIMMDPYIEYYDVAAIRPIIESAGAVYSDLEGGRDFKVKNAIAAPPKLHEEVLKLL